MAKALTDIEIKHRLVKLRNYEHILYPAARARIAKLESENQVLKAANADLQSTVAQMAELVQKLKLQVEMLNTKVFGKRRGKHGGGSGPNSTPPPNEPNGSNSPRHG